MNCIIANGTKRWTIIRSGGDSYYGSQQNVDNEEKNILSGQCEYLIENPRYFFQIYASLIIKVSTKLSHINIRCSQRTGIFHSFDREFRRVYISNQYILRSCFWHEIIFVDERGISLSICSTDIFSNLGWVLFW